MLWEHWLLKKSLLLIYLFDINFSFKCILLCNHPLWLFSLLTLLQLPMGKSKFFLGKHHIALENVCACILSCFSHVWLCATPWLGPIRPLCPWDFPGKNAGMGCHALFPGALPDLGIKLCLEYCLHWQVGSLLLAALVKSLKICIVYGNLNRNCTLLLCENCIKLNYIEIIFKNFVIHTVKCYSVVNEAEGDFFGIPWLFLWSDGCCQFDL